ncbi:MAG: DoxX family protein [Bacteroidales bacterium]|nr:DoxX family protein [Bacteroidales bacterium]MCF8333200.1 DoxX family protein [Bacteroidales bacterium]
MKVIRLVSRFIVGLTFIFSGFVKGIDPMGTMYKIEDYLVAYNLDWAMPAAIYLSFLLVTIEFSIGVFLLLNLRIKQTTWAVLVMMVFFTIVTLFDALYNPVPDCGCFGEAIKLSNWETFYKNVFLMIPTLIIFFTHKYRQITISQKKQDTVALLFVIAFFMVSYYSYTNLPPIDFRDWKVGKNMKQSGKEKYYLVYENKESGEKKKYLASEIPYEDSVWMKNWKFVEQQIDDSQVEHKHHLQIMDYNNNDMTREIIENADYQFLIAAYSLDEADKKGVEKVVKLYKKLKDKGYDFALLTSSLKKRVDELTKKYDTSLPAYQADGIELKAMIRSNPGLLLLKNGVVKQKWHYSNIPNTKEILQKYPAK